LFLVTEDRQVALMAIFPPISRAGGQKGSPEVHGRVTGSGDCHGGPHHDKVPDCDRFAALFDPWTTRMPSCSIARRAFLTRTLGLGLGAGAWVGSPSPAAAQPAPAEPTPTERAAMAASARAFMQKYAVPGFSVAVGHAGRLIYMDAFGLADRDKSEALSPLHLFRIASVTKPITSAAIFSLIEQNRLHLGDRVFGPGGVLGSDFGAPPYRPQVVEITIEHLLTHTGGGWSNDRDDPMFMNAGMTHAQLIEWVLRNRPLDHPPGQSYAYSNFGYCVLGRVIEKIARQSYAEFVGNAVLKRCGITDMAIAGNTLAQRRRGEVAYYGQGHENPYDMNVTRMDSHGGWIARPADLLQFAMQVDGFSANILKPDTIRIMTTASRPNEGYAKGWSVNKANNWWHNGSLPGTSTIMVRTHSGYCWAAFINTRRPDSAIDGDLDQLIWTMVAQVKSWHA
jgi:CubicO group peptidase (beta-lactamase class C family)